jgi:hypothetical protein
LILANKSNRACNQRGAFAINWNKRLRGVGVTEKPDINKSVYFWITGLFIFFIPVIVCVILSNPYGIYPWDNHSTFIGLGARQTKLSLYNHFDKSADLIILGSSRAFTISPAYLAIKYPVHPFNMSVEVGSPADDLVFTKYIIHKQPDSIPKVFMVELVTAGLRSILWHTPMQLATLVPIYYQPALLYDYVNSTLNIQSLSDSILMGNTGSPLGDFWKFGQDGWYLPVIDDPADFYKTQLVLGGADDFSTTLCTSLDPEGEKIINSMIDLAHKYQFSIVFYRSPLNADLYKMFKTSVPAYTDCKKLVDAYFQEITSTHSNIFFQDLSEYQPIVSLKMTGFIDGQHLTPYGANKVVDTLAPEIRSALDWTLNARQGISKP